MLTTAAKFVLLLHKSDFESLTSSFMMQASSYVCRCTYLNLLAVSAQMCACVARPRPKTTPHTHVCPSVSMGRTNAETGTPGALSCLG